MGPTRSSVAVAAATDDKEETHDDLSSDPGGGGLTGSGFTFAVDVALAKAQVPNFLGVLVNGFASRFKEVPSWNSQNLQNTPLSGNFHGRWPLFPNTVTDTGDRPISIPNQTAFDTQVTATDADAGGVTLRFSEPLDPREFGLGVDLAPAWSTTWAADHTSVRITYRDRITCRGDVHLIVFRAVDTAGSMIGGPQQFTVAGQAKGPACGAAPARTGEG